jgi:hypothetical protein
LGGTTGAVLAAKLAVLGLPLTGTQVWRFGPVEPDSTRKIVLLPSESHFDCVTASAIGQHVQVCARIDPTRYCQGGPNDGRKCPPADCGAGNPCANIPGQGVVDCAAGGGNITNYDSLVQIDHDTNRPYFGGPPPTPTIENLGFPLDPDCTATFTAPDGSVLHSCIEPEFTATPTRTPTSATPPPTPGDGTPTWTETATSVPGTPTLTPTPVKTATPRAVAAATCSGSSHMHPNVCNSPTLQTFTGASPAGGFRLHEAIALSFVLEKSAGIACIKTSCFCASGSCIGGATPEAQCYSDGDCGGGRCSTNPKKCTGGSPAAGTPTPTTTGASCSVDGDCLGGGTCAVQPINGAACTSDADCSGFPGQVSPGTCSVCPPDSCPVQDGDLQIVGDITSGQAKGIVWNISDTAQTIGTTGPGNGAPICNFLSVDKTCPTTSTGVPIDLTSIGGSCTSDLPATLSGATVSLAYPAIDIQTVQDFVATLTLQCQ